MAFQFSLDSTRGEFIDVVAPPLKHRLLTGQSSSSEEIVISDEERQQLASSLSAFFLKLEQGENVLGIDLRWSKLVDRRFDFDLDEHDRTNLIAATITPDLLEDARFVAQLFSQGREVQASSNEQFQLQDSVRRILRPFATSIPSYEPVVYKGAQMDCGFSGGARVKAENHVAHRRALHGNMSFAPELATHSLVDGMTEVQYSAGSFQTMEQELIRNYEMAAALLKVVTEKTQPNTEEGVVPGMQALQNFCVQLRQSGVDPALMLSSILSRNQQFSFGVSALGCGMTVQIPYIDSLTRKLVQSMTEVWNERSIQNVVVTTARVDGNLVKNYISHIKSRGVVEHYTDSILIYRHTDSRLLLYDYGCVEDKLVFLAAANKEFTMNELEDISGAEIYHCSRDDDGNFKEGDAAAHPRFRLLQKLAKRLKPIRKQRDGSFLKASSKCRLHHCPGLCAKLKRHPSQLGCWKHLISGRPPTTEDAEKLLEANVMEVLALLTLWYQDPFYFQLSYESVLDPELRRSYLPYMTPVLGHVAYSVPPNVDENQMYSHVPDPFEKRTALVTVVAHKNHRGRRRAVNPESKELWRQSAALIDRTTAHRARVPFPSRAFGRGLGHPQETRQINYVRFADDFLIGVIGPRALAERIRGLVTRFIEVRLKLRLNLDKTRLPVQSPAANTGDSSTRYLGQCGF
ncbi:hypothetical protein AXG93_4683s1010 [Marchantia polymorpha subsp. ruderalis]|uniref:Reverse transcriptase domain-containing protein n=1 Tax=Marchantia polymorpha subsp. ruderalis TaxID=1480154 RepID=A0A176VBJ9_MARPO|nr:hypothetical protein AXG93_4683s1010 [Marchantia polymorpha subsp. ruderalis]